MTVHNQILQSWPRGRNSVLQRERPVSSSNRAQALGERSVIRRKGISYKGLHIGYRAVAAWCEARSATNTSNALSECAVDAGTLEVLLAKQRQQKLWVLALIDHHPDTR